MYISGCYGLPIEEESPTSFASQEVAYCGINIQMEPLLSQRYAPLHHHVRPRKNYMLSHMLSDLVSIEKPIKKSIQMPKHPFRLLDLPVEIRRMIFECYFGDWEVTLDIDRLSMLRSKLNVQGVPPVDLLLTSRAIYRETRDLRINTFNGRLNLNNVFILVTIRRKERFDWLIQNVRILHFSDSSVHPERWNRYYDNFPHLQRVEIEFPSVIRLDDRCSKLGEVLNGKYDDVLLENLDHFRLALVDQLSDMVHVTVSQRYCLKEEVGTWKGILVCFKASNFPLQSTNHAEGCEDTTSTKWYQDYRQEARKRCKYSEQATIRETIGALKNKKGIVPNVGSIRDEFHPADAQIVGRLFDCL